MESGDKKEIKLISLLDYLQQIRPLHGSGYSSCKFSSLISSILRGSLSFLNVTCLHITPNKLSAIQMDFEHLVMLLNPTDTYVNKQLHTQSSLHAPQWVFQETTHIFTSLKIQPICNMSFIKCWI